jgi:hypothetical protein
LWSIGNYYGIEEWVWKTAAEKRLADKSVVKQVTGGLARILTKGIPEPAHRALAVVDRYGILSVLAQILFGLVA